MPNDQEILKPKWEATVSKRLKASADEIWPLVQDFFGIHKYFPSLSASYGIQGNNGEIGSIRYCEGFQIPSQEEIKSGGVSNGGGGKQPVVFSWSKEKITSVDPTRKSLSYEIVDSNIGFHSYVSTIKVLMSSESRGESAVGCGGGSGGDGGGCVVEWSFSVDPVEGLEFEDLAKKYELGLQIMAQKMEDSLQKS